MYGPLLTVLFAGVFRMFGLSLLAARIVMSIFALALALFLSAVLCRAKNRDCSLFALFLFLGINLRTNLVFFSMQPDCVAALCAVAALYFWITRESSWAHAAVSIALFVAAMLFKQTSAAFALITIAYVLMWRRPLHLRHFLPAFIPMMSILLTLGAIRLFWPQLFTAMVTVPASIKIYPARALRITLYLFATFPIFLTALLSILRPAKPIDERERWVWSAVAVLVPVGIWTMCKSGSDYNSLLFAYLAMTSLFVLRWETIADWLNSLPVARSVLAGIVIALAILVSFFARLDKPLHFSSPAAAMKCDAAVAVARQLGASVITPQDPTIAYRANGYFGRSLFFELDAHAVNGNWPSELPMSILQELEHADYIVAVHSYVPTPVFENSLWQKGFRAIAVPELAGSAYTVWTRARE